VDRAGLEGATGRAIGTGTLARAGRDTGTGRDADAGGRYAPLAITTGCVGSATAWLAVCCALVMRGIETKAAAVAERNTNERRIKPRVFGVEQTISASAFRSFF